MSDVKGLESSHCPLLEQVTAQALCEHVELHVPGLLHISVVKGFESSHCALFEHVIVTPLSIVPSQLSSIPLHVSVIGSVAPVHDPNEDQ